MLCHSAAPSQGASRVMRCSGYRIADITCLVAIVCRKPLPVCNECHLLVQFPYCWCTSHNAGFASHITSNRLIRTVACVHYFCIRSDAPCVQAEFAIASSGAGPSAEPGPAAPWSGFWTQPAVPPNNLVRGCLVHHAQPTSQTCE